MAVLIPEEASHLVLAALRSYQENRYNAPQDLRDIETCNDEQRPFTDDEIDQLCESINCGGQTSPVETRVVIDRTGGTVNAIFADKPGIEFLFVDSDVYEEDQDVVRFEGEDFFILHEDATHDPARTSEWFDASLAKAKDA